MNFQPSQHSYGAGYGAVDTAALKTSQNKWPASPRPSDIDIISVSIPLKKGTKTIQVTRKAADALKEIALWWDENIEPIETIYGYNYRTVRGYEDTISNHGSGTAIDINATKHPLGAEGTIPFLKRAELTAKATSLGLLWGGDYRRRKDEMHVETLSPTVELFRKTAMAGAAVWVGTTVVGLLTLGVVLAVRKKKQRRHPLED